MIVLRIVAFVLGAALVVWTLLSAVQLVVLPRSTRLLFSRLVYTPLLQMFNWRTRSAETFEERDRIMALYAPVALLLTPVMWLVLVLIGYTAVFWALGVEPLGDAFVMSGSSLYTLGFALDSNLARIAFIFSEATIGLGLVALLISYLPTIYSAFSERERAVTMLEVRAGSPPSAIEMLTRFQRITNPGAFHDALGDLFSEWESWFARLEETHTSLAALPFFRSPRSHNSWVTAAGTVLDGASLYMALFDTPLYYKAAMCVRSGYLALRHIASAFNMPFNPDPQPTDPVSITHEEFIQAYETLVEQGLPVTVDREAAWLAYRGWRVNYDAVLLQLAALTMAPYAPWSSDRSLSAGRESRRRRLRERFGRIRRHRPAQTDA